MLSRLFKKKKFWVEERPVTYIPGRAILGSTGVEAAEEAMLLHNKENRGTRETLGTEKQRQKRCHPASARPETEAPPPPPPPPPVTNGLQPRVKGPEAELAAPPPVASGRGLALAIEPRDRFSFGEFAEEQEAIARNKRAEAAAAKAAKGKAVARKAVAAAVSKPFRCRFKAVSKPHICPS